MTLISFQGGKAVLRAGKVGAEQECCCGGGGGCQPVTLCCQSLSALWNGINYLLDPSAGLGTECVNGELYGYVDSIVTDGTCFGGGACTFTARVYFTATFTPNGNCYDVSDIAVHDVVFTNVNCACEGSLDDITIFNPC